MLELPSAGGNGWSKNEDDILVPTKNVMPAAPKGFDQLKTCKCKSGENNQCASRQKELLCCDGCYCEENCEIEINIQWKVTKTTSDYQISQ